MAVDQTVKDCSKCAKTTMHMRPGTNHVLHLVLTLFCCGWWLPVWILSMIKIGGWTCQECGKRSSNAPVLVSAIIAMIGGAYTINSAYNARTQYEPPVTPNAPAVAPATPTTESKPEPEKTTESEPIPVTEPEPMPTQPTVTPTTEPAPEPKPIEPPPEPVKKKLQPMQEVRTWSDTTGKFSVQARYGGTLGDKVLLLKEDGTSVKVPLEKLSDDDKEWIQNRKR
jgi:hypothetical protein